MYFIYFCLLFGSYSTLLRGYSWLCAQWSLLRVLSKHVVPGVEPRHAKPVPSLLSCLSSPQAVFLVHFLSRFKWTTKQRKEIKTLKHVYVTNILFWSLLSLVNLRIYWIQIKTLNTLVWLDRATYNFKLCSTNTMLFY